MAITKMIQVNVGHAKGASTVPAGTITKNDTGTVLPSNTQRGSV